MCPFIIEQERVVEHFCQRLEIIKDISDGSKNQAVIRGRRGAGGEEGNPPAFIPLRHN